MPLQKECVCVCVCRWLSVDVQSMPDYDVTDQVTWWFEKWIFQGWCYTQDGPSYNHLGYTQDSKLTNPEPSPNSLMVTVTLVRSLNRTNKTPHVTKIATLLPKIYNNCRWSAIDLHCPANSQNWQIVQDGPAYNQCVFSNSLMDSTNRDVDVVSSPRTSLVVGSCM